MKMFSRARKDDGSILVFGIGLAVTALMIATLAINVASLWVTRNVLDGIADGAALSAAQAIDIDGIYQEGLGGSLKLDETLARIRVVEYVRVAEAAKQVEEFSVKSVISIWHKCRSDFARNTEAPIWVLAADSSANCGQFCEGN